MKRTTKIKYWKATRLQRYKKAKLFWKRYRKRKKKTPKGFFLIHAPYKFDIISNKNRIKLLYFIAQLRHAALHDSQPKILINFSKTNTMRTGGTLLFLSELRNILNLKQSNVKIRSTRPVNRKASQVLQQIDIYYMLKQWKKVRPTFDDVVKWRVSYGKRAEGDKYDNILGQYNGIITPALASSLYVGITEAMTNCMNHAYIQERSCGIVKEDSEAWWMFSQERNDRITVAFCDLGIGIPGSLPKQSPGIWNRLLALGKTDNEGEILRETVEARKTRTGQKHRGKGIIQLVRIALDKPGCDMRILSNHGLFQIVNGKELPPKHYPTSINGTLIEWSIPLTPKVPYDNKND